MLSNWNPEKNIQNFTTLNRIVMLQIFLIIYSLKSISCFRFCLYINSFLYAKLVWYFFKVKYTIIYIFLNRQTQMLKYMHEGIFSNWSSVKKYIFFSIRKLLYFWSWHYCRNYLCSPYVLKSVKCTLTKNSSLICLNFSWMQKNYWILECYVLLHINI